jgi:hypothetical protein
MKVKDLIDVLSGMDEELEVTVADYDDDTDGEILFKKPNGCEQLTVNGRFLSVIYFQKAYKLSNRK